jgi:nucleotide-binding universal stress UspA family protein
MDTEGRRRTVIVGVDGSEEALRAVRWAVPEARRRQATLRLVTAFAWTDDRMVGWPGLGQAAYGERLRAAAEHDLAAAASVAAQLDPDLPVEQDLVLGFPGGVLVDQARGAELLVVGDNGRGRLGSVLAGSVAVGVAAHAACPVVVVRGVEPQPDERLPVVVGIDGTPLSEAAVAFAFEAASARRAPLVAVHTWVGPLIAELVDWQSAAVESEESLAERLAGWGAKYPDVHVQRVVARTSAARALLDQAARAQLVVVGCRGHGEMAGLLLDSVSNALVHAAPCPVVIVR